MHADTLDGLQSQCQLGAEAAPWTLLCAALYIECKTEEVDERHSSKKCTHQAGCKRRRRGGRRRGASRARWRWIVQHRGGSSSRPRRPGVERFPIRQDSGNRHRGRRRGDTADGHFWRSLCMADEGGGVRIPRRGHLSSCKVFSRAAIEVLSPPVMKVFPIVLASFLVSVSLTADPLITRAQQREKAGDTEGAAHLYAAWLQANAGASGAARVFSRYFRLENDYFAL